MFNMDGTIHYPPAMHQPLSQPPHGFVPLAPGTPIDKAIHTASSKTDAKIVSSRGWVIGKIVLGGLSIVSGLLVIGIAAGLVAAQSPYPTDSGYLDAALALPPAVLAVAWQVAEFVTRCVRRNRGIHPGAHVGVHLVVWLAGVTAGGLIASDFALDDEFNYWWLVGGNSSSNNTTGYALYLDLEEALAVCVWPLVVVNLILFVRACIECHRRNMNRALHRHNKKQQLASLSAWTPSSIQAQTNPYFQAQQQQQYQQQQPYPSPPPATVDARQPPPTELGSAVQKSPEHAAVEMAGMPKYMEMAAAPPRPVARNGGQELYHELGGDSTHVLRDRG